jgi:hypothetical protein
MVRKERSEINTCPNVDGWEQQSTYLGRCALKPLAFFNLHVYGTPPFPIRPCRTPSHAHTLWRALYSSCRHQKIHRRGGSAGALLWFVKRCLIPLFGVWIFRRLYNGPVIDGCRISIDGVRLWNFLPEQVIVLKRVRHAWSWETTPGVPPNRVKWYHCFDALFLSPPALWQMKISIYEVQAALYVLLTCLISICSSFD